MRHDAPKMPGIGGATPCADGYDGPIPLYTKLKCNNAVTNDLGENQGSNDVISLVISLLLV